MTENNLYEQLARHMNLKHPDVIYHFDLSGVNNASKYTRSLYSRLNGRAWPDMFIAHPCWDHEGGQNNGLRYLGLFLELKREGTVIRKKDGSLRSDPHLIEQATMLHELRERGYQAKFAVGFDEAVALIEEYLS